MNGGKGYIITQQKLVQCGPNDSLIQHMHMCLSCTRQHFVSIDESLLDILSFCCQNVAFCFLSAFLRVFFMELYSCFTTYQSMPRISPQTFSLLCQTLILGDLIHIQGFNTIIFDNHQIYIYLQSRSLSSTPNSPWMPNRHQLNKAKFNSFSSPICSYASLSHLSKWQLYFIKCGGQIPSGYLFESSLTLPMQSTNQPCQLYP